MLHLTPVENFTNESHEKRVSEIDIHYFKRVFLLKLIYILFTLYGNPFPFVDKKGVRQVKDGQLRSPYKSTVCSCYVVGRKGSGRGCVQGNRKI